MLPRYLLQSKYLAIHSLPSQLYTAHSIEDAAPVEGHEDEGVDGDEDGDDDEVLHAGAPQRPERPHGGERVVGRGEGDAEQDEQQVRHLNMQDNICTTINI